MQGKTKRPKGERVPGPGTYSPMQALTKDSAPKFGIGTSPKIQKDLTTRRIVPGPGTYPVKRPASAKAAPSWGFGSDSKSKRIRNDVPGPG